MYLYFLQVLLKYFINIIKVHKSSVGTSKVCRLRRKIPRGLRDRTQGKPTALTKEPSLFNLMYVSIVNIIQAP